MRKVEYMVFDWNESGTNDVALVVNGKVVEILHDLTFGIDTNNYYKTEIMPSTFAASVSLYTIIRNLSLGAIHSNNSQYNRFMMLISKGDGI